MIFFINYHRVNVALIQAVVLARLSFFRPKCTYIVRADQKFLLQFTFEIGNNNSTIQGSFIRQLFLLWGYQMFKQKYVNRRMRRFFLLFLNLIFK